MAITKYNLYDSGSRTNCNALCLAFLRDALIPDWLGENGTVEADAANVALYVLKDGDGNTIAKLFNAAGTAQGSPATMFYVDSTHTIGFSGTSNSSYKTGYKTSKGAMIIIDYYYSSSSYNTGGGILIFGKTNNGKLAMVLKSPLAYDSGGYKNYASTAYGVVTGARGDDISSLTHSLTFGPSGSSYSQVLSENENQTVLCPTPTHSNSGETSIIEGVFMMPWSQYRNEGILQINLKRYATNGYWALED
jgi:hypothetical protein